MKKNKRKKKVSGGHDNSNQGPFFPSIQTKLAIGKADDAFEKQADTVADKVVNASTESTSIQKKGGEEEQLQEKPLSQSISTLQKQEMPTEEEPVQKAEEKEEEPVQKMEEEEAIQQKTDEEEQSVQKMEEEEAVQQKGEEEEAQTKPEEEEETVQKKANGNNANPRIESTLKATKGQGQKMDPSTQRSMEKGFGADFSDINIHTDSKAQETSQELGAQAFTTGNDIYFNKGKYNPNSKEGKHLLAHELTHTIQQTGSNQKKVQKQVSRNQGEANNSSCRRLRPQERRSILSQLRQGLSRMNEYLTNPELLIGQGRSQIEIQNMNAHVNATIVLTQECFSAFQSNSINECVAPDSCPNSANACFIPVENQFRFQPIITERIDRFTTGAILHEFKHFKQHQQHSEEVAASSSALIHTGVNELGLEYEAALADAIFSGTILRQANSTSGANNGSGVPFLTADIPQEALRFGLQHGPGVMPSQQNELPIISGGYRDQINRNSPVVHYPGQLMDDGQLIIRNRQWSQISLGNFTETEILAKIPVKRAFWNSTEASNYQQGNYRRGVITIHRAGSSGQEVITQITIGQPLQRGTVLQEGNAVEERPIRMPN